MNVLSGYKTYITAAAGIVGAVALYASGQDSLAQAVQLGITALLGAFIRAGVATSSNS